MPSSRFRASDDINLFYTIDGPTDADAVCLCHCFGSNHRYWDFHLPALQDFRILRYDMRGHGASQACPGPWTLGRLALDAIELVDELSIDRVHFVGVSMGGMIGQTLALEHPDRLLTLTLANSPCHYSDAQIALWRERAQQVLEDGTASVAAALMQRWFTDEAAARQTAGYQYIDRAFGEFSAQSFASATAAICQLNTTDSLHLIRAPTLLFGSLDDPGVPVEVSELMAQRIVGSQLHWLSPSRHLATLEQVDVFNSILRQFLNTHAIPKNV